MIQSVIDSANGEAPGQGQTESQGNEELDLQLYAFFSVLQLSGKSWPLRSCRRYSALIIGCVEHGVELHADRRHSSQQLSLFLLRLDLVFFFFFSPNRNPGRFTSTLLLRFVLEMFEVHSCVAQYVYYTEMSKHTHTNAYKMQTHRGGERSWSCWVIMRDDAVSSIPWTLLKILVCGRMCALSLSSSLSLSLSLSYPLNGLLY